jgi:hypothetical protein
MSIFKFAPCLVPIALLAACGTTEGEFPSLERRPYETKNPIVVPVSPAPAPVGLPGDLAAQVELLSRRHGAAQAMFAKDLPAVQTLASQAAGSAPGSERWVNAHLQLSRLDKARGDSVAVVREFDALIAEQGERNPALLPLLTNAQEPFADAVAAQNSEIERLSRLIGE